MTSNSHQPNIPSMFPTPLQSRARTPADIARAVADWTRAGLKVTAWFVLATFGLGTAYLCLRGLIWALKLGQSALGI
jgi:hypothetical protein